MKAVVLEEPRKFIHQEIPEPDPPAPGEALVRVHRVGICGTDISGYLGKFPFYSYPRIPGHELGVEVVELGEGVSNVAVPDNDQRFAAEMTMAVFCAGLSGSVGFSVTLR